MEIARAVDHAHPASANLTFELELSREHRWEQRVAHGAATRIAGRRSGILDAAARDTLAGAVRCRRPRNVRTRRLTLQFLLEGKRGRGRDRHHQVAIFLCERELAPLVAERDDANHRVLGAQERHDQPRARVGQPLALRIGQPGEGRAVRRQIDGQRRVRAGDQRCERTRSFERPNALAGVAELEAVIVASRAW